MKFNTLRSFLVGLACLVSITLSATAQTQLKGWCVTGTGNGTALAYVVGSASAAYSGPAVLQYLNVKSDLSTSVVKFYTSGQGYSIITNTDNSTYTTNLWLANVTNAETVFPTNASIVVLRHVLKDTYERRVTGISITPGGGTNVTVTVAFTTPPLTGDQIYLETAGATIPVGAASLTVGPVNSGIAYGSNLGGRGPLPFLIDLTGTSACTIYTASGTYFQ
jgi:hypothetical protein